MSGVDERVERVREALAHPHYVEPLPGNDVIEVRMPKRIYDEALAALDSIVGALPACGVQGVGYKIGCGEQIASIGELYRCATCAVPFHEDCLRAHFNHRDDFVPSPSNVERVVMAEAAVASLEQRADDAEQTLRAIASSDITCAQEDGTEDGVDCATAYAEGDLDGAMPEDWCPQCYFVFVARAAVDAYETETGTWDAWFVRHPGHMVNGYCLSHPPGCNRRCLDDRPQGPAPWEPAAAVVSAEPTEEQG